MIARRFGWKCRYKETIDNQTKNFLGNEMFFHQDPAPNFIPKFYFCTQILFLSRNWWPRLLSLHSTFLPQTLRVNLKLSTFNHGRTRNFASQKITFGHFSRSLSDSFVRNFEIFWGGKMKPGKIEALMDLKNAQRKQVLDNLFWIRTL